jgi:N-acetylneuraminic acid mutarotase
MPTPRGNLAVTVVNGILYAVGGGTACHRCGPLNIVEAYDPATDSWSTKSSMPTKRAGLAASAFGNDLYAVGGADKVRTLHKVEVYDTVTNAWTAAAPMPTARWALATRFDGSTLYAVGGYNQSDGVALNTVEAFAP